MAELVGYEGLQIKSYSGANWFTASGVRQKRHAIEKKGLRPFKHCLHITLTIDPIVGNQKEAYERGKDRIRRFLSSFRKVIGRKFAWAWKLELQENGYPHWHMLIDYKKKIPADALSFVSDWWGLGRVKVQRLRSKTFKYLFKYVSKEVSGCVDEETGIALPDWVLDYQKKLKDGRSSSGIRFWQTGGDFYEKVEEAKKEEPESEENKEQQYCLIPYTIRNRARIWIRKATVYIKDEAGRYRASRQVYFKRPYCDVAMKVIMDFVNGKAAPVQGALGFRCRLTSLSKDIDICQMQLIQKMCFLSSRETVFFSVD